MNWRSPKSKSAPAMYAESLDLSSTFREILESESLHPSATGSSVTSWLPALVPQSLRLVRGLLLVSLSAAGSTMAALGLGLLAYLLLSRTLTPAQHLHSRTLHLDYSQTDLIAQTAFLPAEEYGDGALPPNLPASTRFLPAGQRVDVWVELQLPTASSCASCRGGMAQVVAELVTIDGRTAARTSRPLLLRNGGSGLWSLLTAPLRWVGLMADAHAVKVPLFTNYKEKEKLPFVVFQVAVKTRDPSWAPEVLSASVHVRLRMGLVTRLLYALRPGMLPMALLAAAAVAAVLGGSTAAVVFLALWAYTIWGGTAGAEQDGTARAAGSEVEELSSTLSGADESGSISGLSEVESVDRRKVSEAASRAAPAWQANELEEDWQEVEEPEVAETSAAGASGSGRAAGAAAAAVAAGKQPAPGPGPAMSTEDTAFYGSEAAAWREGSGLVRRRPPAANIGRRGSGGGL